MCNTIVGAGAVGARAALRYIAPDPAPTKRCDSLWLRLRNTDINFLILIILRNLAAKRRLHCSNSNKKFLFIV
jgi:hypothetical protein